MYIILKLIETFQQYNHIIIILQWYTLKYTNNLTSKIDGAVDKMFNTLIHYEKRIIL